MKRKDVNKIRLLAIALISLCVIATGAIYSFKAFRQGDVAGGFLGGLIAVLIFVFAMFVYLRGNEDLKKGFPLKDERSIRVMEKASSKAFYVSLYVLLAIGFLSDFVKFRDVSQATGVSVGLMALLFAGFWVYYNRKGE